MTPLPKTLAGGISLLLIFALTLSSCSEQPDLVLASYEANRTATDYILRLTVKNIGNAPSGEYLVYVNYLNPSPPSGENEIQIQESEQVPALKPQGAYSFTKTALINHMRLKAIRTIQVLVDAKDYVIEGDEGNNTEEFDVIP